METPGDTSLSRELNSVKQERHHIDDINMSI